VKSGSLRPLIILGVISTFVALGGGAERVRPSEAAVTVVAGAGDIAGSGSGDSQTAAIINGLPGNTQIFTLGDNAYPDGTLAQFNSYYEPTWGQFKSRTRPVIGNHDSHTSGAPGYFDYWEAAGVYAGNRGEGWYAYDAGDWRIYSLNSECNGTSYDFCNHTAQKAWLQADLSANPRTCVLAMWHRATIAPSSSHTDDEGNFSDPGGNNVWQILYDAGADLVLSGHDHIYARFAGYNRDATGVEANGMRHFIVGTGGRSLYTINSSPPGMEASQDTTFGVLKMTLNPTSFSWQFLPVAGGNYADSGSANCRGQAPPDNDGDGWSNSAEGVIGTNPNAACGANAWPPDINNDGFVSTFDIAQLTGSFGMGVPPAPPRKSIAPATPDSFVDTGDISRMTGLFNSGC
jgi:Calcineurin-like phosphoesterase